jgi:hypothetical protein
MNLPSTPDLSIYRLALDALASPQPLSVSPATLNSLMVATLDLLIEEKISAALWVKLPPTQGWEAELKRYQQQNRVPQTIFMCSCLGDEWVEITDGVDKAAEIEGDTQIFSVQLAAESQLRREYFLLVLCERFSSLIVAYNPESAAVALHESQPLQVVCTFERYVIQQIFRGIKGTIAATDTTPKELLDRWETLSASLAASDEKVLLTQLLMKYVQRAEAFLKQVIPSDSLLPSSDAADYTTPLRCQQEAATAIPSPLNDDLLNKYELFKRVAQELRTPLTNMKTALKLLDSGQLKPAQRQRYMQLLNRECDRQNSLIAGLLELVQLDSETQPILMPSVQLADIVPGVVSTYQPLAQEKGVQLGYTIPAGLPVIFCLETWLRQIVINLLHNSLKFTPAGGQVKVQVTRQGEYVQLAFRDTGIGIPTHEIPKIFDSFYRGRAATAENTSAGLGLTIVRQLLLRCGGSISVTSRLGEGSNFKVLLPVTSPTN